MPTEEDVDPIALTDAGPEVMRYIEDGSIRPPDRERSAAACTPSAWDNRGHATETATATTLSRRPVRARLPGPARNIGG